MIKLSRDQDPYSQIYNRDYFCHPKAIARLRQKGILAEDLPHNCIDCLISDCPDANPKARPAKFVTPQQIALNEKHRKYRNVSTHAPWQVKDLRQPIPFRRLSRNLPPPDSVLKVTAS